MNLLLDIQVIGWLLVGLAGFQVIPLVCAWIYGEPSLGYALSAAAALIYGLPLALSVRPPDRRMRPRDGFVAVSAAWAAASIFGALPYLLTGSLGPADALFESVSGFTTTGSSVLTDVEAAPHALLLWRSLTQWLGGMGIIVFTIAVLPLLGIGGMQLFRAEVPGPVADKLTPRIAVTARRLWLIYVGLTAMACAALRVAGLSTFDSVCHALTLLSSGGFSTRNASIGAFELPAVEWIAVVFMLAAGTNFAIHYRVLTGQLRRVARDVELRFFAVCVVLLAGAMAWSLSGPWASGGSAPAVRDAVFQSVSLMTTTGYATADYEAWPALSQLLVVHLLVVGGMTGSTSGGIKSLRLLLGIRALRAFVFRTAHPKSVRLVRYSGRAVSDDVVNGVLVFFLAYLAIALASATVVAGAGYDAATAFSAALTSLGNVGPGLGEVGPSENFAHFPTAVKLWLSLSMLAGRLEIFTLLVLFEPHFWKR